LKGRLEDSLSGVNVNQCKLLRMIVARSRYDSLLLRLRFVSDLVNKHVNLAQTGQCAKGEAKNCQQKHKELDEGLVFQHRWVAL
jgi:hypothetical protein